MGNEAVRTVLFACLSLSMLAMLSLTSLASASFKTVNSERKVSLDQNTPENQQENDNDTNEVDDDAAMIFELATTIAPILTQRRLYLTKAHTYSDHDQEITPPPPKF
jgi:hypothetical protein